MVDGGDFYVMKDPNVRPHPTPQCNLMWTYNFSTQSPRDAQGKQCVDVLIEEFASFFGPGGRLARCRCAWTPARPSRPRT